MSALVMVLVLLVAPFTALAETREELLQNAQPMPAKVTCYAPGPNDNIEGPWATSRPRPPDVGGGNIPMTLDCVRLGQCKYVTLAANPNYYGRYFYIGDVTYTSPMKGPDGQGREYTLKDVIGYVHDTGGAFSSTGCSRWNTCADIGKKFDIALGDFRGWNSRNASWFVDTQAFCRNRQTTFYLLGSQPVNPPQVVASDTGNRVPVVPGTQTAGNYGPFGLGTQPFHPGQNMSGFFGNMPSPSAPPGQSGLQPTSVSPVGSSPTASAPPIQGTPAPVFASGPSSGRIMVQPATLTRAASGVVSWTSVNMRPSTCALMVNGTMLAQANEGTRRIPDDALSGSRVEFSLKCTTAGGQSFDRTESRDVQ